MAMPVEMIDASGKLLEIRIRGMLKKADYDRIVEIAKEAISREGKVRALATEGSDRPARWQTRIAVTHRQIVNVGPTVDLR